MATDAMFTTDELLASVKGEVLSQGDATYDDQRAVYNSMIDKRPAIIVRPTGAADVIEAVNFARERGLPVAVRCGGHSVSGKAAVDDGVLIDLRSLKGTLVDPARGTAHANAGALWGEYDRETQLFGLATPGGRVTTTGVGGFTLGGGYGWLSPVFGLACDNLVGADVVTADGRFVHASESENSDLLWGLRGGSGNFGVVTSYEFRVHKLGPTVLGGMIIHPVESGREVIAAYREFIETAPEELVTAIAVVLAPPEPFVPPEVVGKPVLGIVTMWAGDPAEGEASMSALRAIGPPAIDLVQPMPYTAFQAMLDGFAPQGWRNYHRGEHLPALTDDVADIFLEHGQRIESPMTQAIIFRHGGAVSRVPAGSAAAGHRDAPYMFHPIACWQDAAEDGRHIGWARDMSAALAPHATGGVYLNFEQDEGEAHVQQGYDADTWSRLVALKDEWDPGNLFRINQNIRPSGTAVPEQREG